MDFCEEVREISIKQHLNKSQTRALEKLREASLVAYISRRAMAGRAARSEHVAPGQALNVEIKTFFMSRLGIPIVRVASRLKINRKTVLKYYDNIGIAQSLRDCLKKGRSIPQVAQEHGYPEPLVWSVAFEGKSDQERFQSLNWGLRTWDHWYWNDVDQRFGDNWPGQIPAQLVAHTLFYFTQEGDLVFDPMAGGGVVADTCLAFHRKCWSFDLDDRAETRPEIEAFQWKPQTLLWPVKGKEKPDLIFFDPPYLKLPAASCAECARFCGSTSWQTNTQKTVSQVFLEKII